MQKEKYTIFWDGRPYGITLMSAVAEGITNYFTKKMGINISQVITKYKEGKGIFLLKTNDIIEGGKAIVEKIVNENFFETDKKDILDATNKIDIISKEISEKEFENKTDEELILLFKKFIETFKEFYGKAFTPIFLESGENILSKMSAEIIKTKVSKERFAEYYTTLLTPTEPTIIAKEDLLFLKLVKGLLERHLEKMTRSETFKSHIKRWQWITFDIHNRIGWKEEEYGKRLVDTLQLQSLKQKIAEIADKSEIIKKKQQEILKTLELTPEESKIIEATRQYGSLKEYRKNMIVLSWFRLLPLLDEIALRVGSDNNKIQYFLAEEIEKIFDSYNENLAEERIKESVLITENGASGVLTGKECEDFCRNIVVEEPDKEANEIIGMTACAGYAKGTVRIVNTIEDASKMQQGDILVSQATFPELVPAMKKAAAIVTDDGGITCHAAIVSRELNIPCVIGTKFATKILKDEDEVEVDAENGIVKLLSKKKSDDIAEKSEKTTPQISRPTKLVIFDAYGVTLTGGYPETMQALGKKYNRDWKELYNIIYKKWFNLAAEKKITQKEAWEKGIKEANLPITIKEIKELHFGLMGINQEMISLIEKVGKETDALLLSKNTREQFAECDKKLGFTKYFKNVINTWELGLPKAGKETYSYIFEKFSVEPEEIIYIDDQEENLTEARKLGVNTIFYKDFEQFKSEFEKIYHPKKIEWIQLSAKQRMSPFPSYYSMECITKDMKQHLGAAYETFMMFSKENVMYIFQDKKEYEDVGKHALKRILENPKFFHEIAEYVEKNGKKFVEKIKEISEKNTSKYANKQLGEFQKLYEKEYKDIYSRYFTILTVEKNLAEYLKDYLKQKGVADNLLDEHFTALISEPRAQVNGQERYAALKLAKRISENKKWQNYFNQKNPEKDIKKDSELNRLFEGHKNSFFWITRDYEDPVLTYSDFVKRIKAILENDPPQKLADFESNLNQISDRIKTIEAEVGIDSYHSNLFAAMREGIHLKELRKSIVSQSLYYYDKILFEIAKRANLSIKEIRHIKTDEVEKVFKNKNLQDELKRRVKLSAFSVKDGKTAVFSGEKANDLYKIIVEIKTDVNELKGYPSSPGIARGKVRKIISPSEISKIKQGEILVSIQIVPSFGPALKKAAGLVCDGGTAITSHSGILAREANIPCVTGTNIATRALNDGDLIEIDGNTGIIKILERKEAARVWRKNFDIVNTDYQLLSGAAKIFYENQMPLLDERYVKEVLITFENGNNTGTYVPKNQLRMSIEKTVEAFEKKIDAVEKIHKKTRDVNTKLFLGLKKVEKIDLKKLSEQQLKNVYKTILPVYLAAHGTSIATTWTVDSDGEDLSNFLINIIKKRTEDLALDINTAESFAILTTPTEETLAQKEEKELFAILSLILKDRKTRELFETQDEKGIIKNLQKTDKSIFRRIVNHEKEWKWMPYGYTGPAYDLGHYIKTLSTFVKEDIEPEKELRKLKASNVETEKKKSELAEKLKLSENEKRMFRQAAEIVWLKAYRKDAQFYAFYVTDMLKAELGKRKGYTLLQMKYLTHDEVSRFEKIPKSELDERYRFSVMYANKGKLKVMTGKKAEEFLKSQEIEKIEIDMNAEIKGTCAYIGKAKGRVKIINTPAELSKMEEGDIMLATTTYPSLMPAMKKAAAIVTDQGGITCHAAIVARELKIPCIVGTKIATKVLKDGDVVEVDATNGIVKKTDNLLKNKNIEDDMEGKNIVWLKDIKVHHLPLVGGKGANLGEMFEKFPVPNGFCITVNAYDKFLDYNKLKEKIAKLLETIDVEDTKSLESNAAKIRRLIQDAVIPPELAEEKKKHYSMLQNKKVAVRSSATAEDLPTASFAGQQETYLNIEGHVDFLNAVKKCWASLYTARAIYYREKNNFRHEDVKISVVVQEMVDAKYAGVMFTLDPIHKKYSLVEAVKGLGEKLVSGQVTPNTYFLDKKTQKIVETNLTFDMDEKVIKDVSKIGEDIEKHYKKPMDVEWVIDKRDMLHIVQARPITTL